MANIGSSISGVPHLKAFGDLADHQLDQMDLSAIMMFIIDTAPPSALYYLASQFGVLGYKGWILATNDAERRELIKNGIALNRHSGTPYAIKKSIVSVGYLSPEIVEGFGNPYDGSWAYDGSRTYSGSGWALFRVRIEIPDDKPIDAEALFLLRKLIESWKPERSHLIDISFILRFEDNPAHEEFVDFGEGSQDSIFPGFTYNGAVQYGGSHQYNKGINQLSMTITNVVTGEITNDEI